MRYVGLVFVLTALGAASFFSCDRMRHPSAPPREAAPEDGAPLDGGAEDDV